MPTPRTVATTSPKIAEEALYSFKTAVSKPLFGYKGKDIILLKSSKQADIESLREIVERRGWSTCRSLSMSPPAQRAISGLSWWTADCREPSIAMLHRENGSAIWREVAGPPLSENP